MGFFSDKLDSPIELEYKRIVKEMKGKGRKNCEIMKGLVSNNSLNQHMSRVGFRCLNLGRYADFSESPNENDFDLGSLVNMAELHDVGYSYMKDEWLIKYDSRGFRVPDDHPLIGSEKVKHIEKYMPGIQEVILSHHERYDGSGFPNGLKGNEIPIYSRIIAVADYFDHLLYDSASQYRKRNDAISKINSEKGKALDPSIVDMLNKVDQFESNNGENSVVTAALGTKTNIKSFISFADNLKRKGHSLNFVVEKIANMCGDDRTADFFGKYAFNILNNPYRTFDNVNIANRPDVNNKTKVTVCVKNIYESFDPNDYVLFNDSIWRINLIDKKRFMLVR